MRSRVSDGESRSSARQSLARPTSGDGGSSPAAKQDSSAPRRADEREAKRWALTRAFPTLENELPRLNLAHLPTAVEWLPRLGAAATIGGLYVKRDDRSAPPYGGNKVRKLELLLGDAVAREASGILTYGSVGSNHVAATAIYGRRCGLRITALLLPQPPSPLVRRNLLISLASGADLIPCAAGTSMRLKAESTQRALREMTARDQAPPVILPFGGSTPLGTIAHVAAAFELRDQVEAGLIPEPDFLYVAVGSIGTAAGLSIGLAAAGLRTRLVGVRAVDAHFATEEALIDHALKTRDLLHALDPTFPRVRLSRRGVVLRHEFFGEEYGRSTPEGERAARQAMDLEGLPLDSTYTAKALAALLADGASGKLRRKTVLFWSTCNSFDVSSLIASADARRLPEELYRYFEVEGAR